MDKDSLQLYPGLNRFLLFIPARNISGMGGSAYRSLSRDFTLYIQSGLLSGSIGDPIRYHSFYNHLIPSDMERVISKSTIGTSVSEQRVPVKETPAIKINIPEKDCTGPVRIGKLLEPVQQIMDHPDRNRLMAELFKDYK